MSAVTSFSNYQGPSAQRSATANKPAAFGNTLTDSIQGGNPSMAGAMSLAAVAGTAATALGTLFGGLRSPKTAALTLAAGLASGTAMYMTAKPDEDMQTRRMDYLA